MADDSFWQSPAGLALLMGGMDFGGGLLSGIGQGQQQGANRNASMQQLLQQLLQQNYQANQQADIQRAGQSLSSSQMNPAAQAEGLSKALVRGNMIGNARPSSMEAPDFMQGFVPQVHGGAMGMIPEGGFGPEITGALSPQGVLSSATAFQKAQANANPNVPTMDLAPAFGQAGVDASGDINAYREQQRGALQQGRDARSTALQQSLQQAQQQEQGGGGFGKKLLGAIGAIAPIALAPFTAGTSLAWLPAAIGAGAGAASGAMGGGGIGGGIVGGAMGGFGGYQAGQHPLFGGGGGRALGGGAPADAGGNMVGMPGATGVPMNLPTTPNYGYPNIRPGDTPTQTLPGLPSLGNGKKSNATGIQARG